VPPAAPPSPPRSPAIEGVGGAELDPWTRFDQALLLACALLPAALAAAGAASSAPASHDEGVVRTVGLGWTGLYRGLDALVAAPLMLVPIGTRALRAGLASALVAGLCGAIAFVVARRFASRVRPASVSARLVAAVAAVGVLAALLAPLWQIEAASPGGSVVGALLVLGAMAAGASAYASAARGEAPGANAEARADAKAHDEARWRGGPRAMALLVGLGASYEPLVLVGVLATLAP
jgi:hypothetical protein